MNIRYTRMSQGFILTRKKIPYVALFDISRRVTTHRISNFAKENSQCFNEASFTIIMMSRISAFNNFITNFAKPTTYLYFT
jgi:hypothetical protein